MRDPSSPIHLLPSLTLLSLPPESGAGTAPEAPAGKPVHAPGEAPVASDSGATRVGLGLDGPSTNVPGEKGLNDVPVPGETTHGSGGSGASMT